MKKSMAVLAAVVSLLVFAAVVIAHTVSNAVVTCQGLTAQFADFTAGSTETLDWSTGQTTVYPITSSSGVIVTPLPVVPPNGTVVTVTGHRTGATDGTFTATSQPLNCQTTPPPVLVPPTPPVTVPPVTIPPTPVHHHKHHKHHKHPRLPCVKVAHKRFHAHIGPQGLLRGNALLSASGPSSVRSITVAVHGAGGHVWTKTYRGHRLSLKLDVTNKRKWGKDTRCGCTYGPKDYVVVTFHYPCGRDVISLPYNNRDSFHLKR